METNAAERWIHATLSADATLTGLVGDRIYNTRRPVGGALPCVIYQLQAPGNDFLVVGGERVWSDMLYVVAGMTESESYGGDLMTIANRIEALLHQGSGSNVAGVVWTCVRIRPFQLPETFQGREYRRLGGTYRIQARAV